QHPPKPRSLRSAVRLAVGHFCGLSRPPAAVSKPAATAWSGVAATGRCGDQAADDEHGSESEDAPGDHDPTADLVKVELCGGEEHRRDRDHDDTPDDGACPHRTGIRRSFGADRNGGLSAAV